MDLDQGPSIVEMENLGEKGVSVVGGFLLEESKSSYSVSVRHGSTLVIFYINHSFQVNFLLSKLC